MKYSYEQFLQEVKKEVRAIRKNATADEKALLDFKTLNPQYAFSCIYGQMTGDCRNKRSCKLIEACCIRFVQNDFVDSVNKDEVIKNINGAKVPKGVYQDRVWKIGHLSALETYILFPRARKKHIIAYIKGKVTKLEL